MRAVLLLALAAFSPFALASPVSRHEVTRLTVNGTATVSTQDVLGDNIRFESAAPDGTRRVTLFKPPLTYELDPRFEEYAVQTQESPSWLALLANWIARPPRVHESGKKMDVYLETVDTGERRQYFGQTAAHLLIRERRVAEPGACGLTGDETRDGWYLPSEDTRAGRSRYGVFDYILTQSTSGICKDILTIHGHPPPVGLAVRETRGSFSTEVVELSTGTLDPGLFEVPSSYKKVDALRGVPRATLAQQREMDWARLRMAFESWWH